MPDLIGFILVILPIALSPGTSFVLAMSNASVAGLRSILPVIVGTGAGITLHSLIGGIGIANLVADNEFALSVIRIIGAVFLLYLGTRLLLVGIKSNHSGPAMRQLVCGGKEAFLLNLVNLRAIVLYMSVVPVFAGTSVINFLMLSSVHTLIMSIWLVVCGFLLTSASQKLKINKLSQIINTLGGISLIVFACVMTVDLLNS